MALTLTLLDPDDGAAVEVAAALARAVEAADAPQWPPTSAYQLAAEVRHGWDGEPARWYLAHADAELVGIGQVHLTERDNLDLAWLGSQVHPAHRRRGHGTAILEQTTAIAQAEGRTLLGIDGWESPGATAFAEQAGFTARSVYAVRRHDVGTPQALARAAELEAEAARAATAYDLEQYVGRSPEALLPGLAEVTAAINDAPTDDLEVEDEVFSAERVRSYEEATTQTRRLYRLVARHRASGERAGHTVVVVEEDRPAIGWQHDTAVVPAHRGHRLGALLKTAMLRWLAETEPALRTVHTFNAASNGPMIAVNEALGHVEIGRVVQFQRRVAPGPVSEDHADG